MIDYKGCGDQAVAYEFGISPNEELLRIQSEYRKKKLKESLLGPIISTTVHIIFIIIASLFKGKARVAAASAAAQKLGDLTAQYDLKLLEWTSDKKGDARFVMYWMYYATQVMFQRGGREWKVWNKKFQSLLMKNQHPDGYWLTLAIQGVETHGCDMSDVDNKIYSTTLSAL
ncbi:hypothetical protein LNTAR_08779 [Lentisphaera araneosa HTCC2155]|uniref:Uncharacterized protein n=1 Tax=Lentisphaera araneosa HTCC2155 TaxID=313628 RepID=A6DHZ7_9BACT|nr:hypothetical protein [Lentisphaera araneosa]EDM28651.1 hypothetical protein LNTAR_08779 [Lentisphaera araneosa HTCC2155]